MSLQKAPLFLSKSGRRDFWIGSMPQLRYRKMKAFSMGTGGGPQSNITLNDLEERGLSVWGKVAVAGASNVTVYEGIEDPECQQNTICEPSTSDRVNRSYDIIYTEIK